MGRLKPTEIPRSLSSPPPFQRGQTDAQRLSGDFAVAKYVIQLMFVSLTFR